MKLLIYGRGYIGRALRAGLGGAFGSARVDDQSGLRAELAALAPECIINAAGLTGRPNIDALESQPENCYQANVLGPAVLAEECRRAGVHLIHIGSGCLFDGGPFDEAATPAPRSTYARSKAAADAALMMLPDVAIVRIRMPIGPVPDPRNLIDKLVSYPRVMGDVPNSVTVLRDLVDAVTWVARSRGSGIYHAVNEGPVTHRQILELYRQHVDASHRNEWLSESDLQGIVAARRSNAVLLNTRMPALRDARVAIEDCLRDRAQAAV
jgi:3,5-epimerase/4-reductase